MWISSNINVIDNVTIFVTKFNTTIMGRTPDIKTKPVATRLPMADYIAILQESSSRGISVSDYVSEKLSIRSNPVTTTTLKEFGGELKESKKVQDLQNKIDLLESENRRMVDVANWLIEHERLWQNWELAKPLKSDLKDVVNRKPGTGYVAKITT